MSRTNEACLTLIKQSEGVRLEAYQGPSGHWLIAYGHKKGVKPGMTVTLEQADALLSQDVSITEQGVSNALQVDTTEDEFSALVCLAYNIGLGNFSKSTVLKKVNAGDKAAAADAFLMWNKMGGKVSTHLAKRRRAERGLFLSAPRSP
ncbi:MAG: lysozyme [Gammaproteobacteria bacterium]|nr:lysozyme [Gammaproteobacteria bacterium]